MKKILFSILFTLIMCCTFTSCDINNSNNWYNPYPYFYGYYWAPNTTNSAGQYAIGGYVNGQTRANANTRAAVSATYDDKFSLFAWTSDSTVMENYHGVFSGNTWGYSEQVKFFDNFVPAYNFIGIIPQDDNYVLNNGSVVVSANTFAVETTDASYTGYDDQEILYATATVEKANYATGASLTFNHANSKVYLKFTSDDANTQIIDYTPYTPGTPGSAAWDETVDVTIYSTTARPAPYLGPLVENVNISDADITYINSKYSCTYNSNVYTDNAVWPGNFSSSATFSGDLDENMWEYLVNKYPALSTVNLGNWASSVSNSNMRLVHIETAPNTAENNKLAYRGWFVNVQNVNFNEGTTIQKVIHHEAVTEVPETGKRGIIVLPATSVLGDGTDAVLSTYPSSANITVSLSGISWESTATNNTFTFTKPTGNVYTTEVASPTTWFTFPKVANTIENLGYTIKFSYIYKGVNVYDARVYIPMDKCNWESGKYYTYVINIKGRGNGHDTPNNEDGDDPVITGSDKYEIIVNTANINDYEEGQKYTFEIQ